MSVDGYPDQIVGSPGEGVGIARIHSGLDGSVLATLANPSATSSANFGYAVAGSGDVDADGIHDVVGTYPFHSPPGLLAAGGVTAYSLLGLPAGHALAVGAGCPSATTGFVPRISTSGGAPVASGNALFAIHLRRGLPASTAVLVAGVSPAWMRHSGDAGFRRDHSQAPVVRGGSGPGARPGHPLGRTADLGVLRRVCARFAQGPTTTIRGRWSALPFPGERVSPRST